MHVKVVKNYLFHKNVVTLFFKIVRKKNLSFMRYNELKIG